MAQAAGLSGAQLAKRAHVTRDTLRSLERGSATVQLDSLIAVLTSLGIVNTMVESVDPWNSNAGRALMEEQLHATPPEPYRIAKQR